jgi:hypothetical protein
MNPDPDPTPNKDAKNIFLLLLLLNHLPPDITSGQGLNGFQQIIFFLQYFLQYVG